MPSAGLLLPEAVYRRALELGRGAAGLTGPNPPVGCVIVRDGAVVGEGATGVIGGPHAEVHALRAAGPAAQGATAVVSLEPCAHHGRTPPCVEALVDAGITEVHVLLADPDPDAAGGLGRLRGLGVRVVEVGAALPHLQREAEHDLRGFLTRVREGRPHVTLKLAQTVDGRTVPPAGGYLTGLAARTHVHALRAESDGVLVGSGTIRSDDPRLDVRHVTAVRAPRPVIVSTEGGVPPGARAVREGTIVVVGPNTPTGTVARLEEAGANVVPVGLETGPGPGGLDLSAVLVALLPERVLTVLAEPGLRLAGALIDRGLVDVIELHVAGGAVASGPIRPALATLAAVAARAASDGVATADGDLIVRVDPTPLRSASGLGEVA